MKKTKNRVDVFGEGDVVLRRLTRSEVLQNLKDIEKVGGDIRPWKSTKVVVAYTDHRAGIGGIVQEGKEVFLCPLTGEDELCLDVNGMILALSTLDGEEVWLTDPTHRQVKNVVGKVFAIGSPSDELTVYLFPVPSNIAEVNKYVRKKATEMGCTKTIECGTCYECGTCKILEEINAELEKNGGI